MTVARACERLSLSPHCAIAGLQVWRGRLPRCRLLYGCCYKRDPTPIAGTRARDVYAAVSSAAEGLTFMPSTSSDQELAQAILGSSSQNAKVTGIGLDLLLGSRSRGDGAIRLLRE